MGNPYSYEAISAALDKLVEENKQLQAEVATLRGALELASIEFKRFNNFGSVVYDGIIAHVDQALQSTTTAGQGLLERLRLAEEVVGAARTHQADHLAFVQAKINYKREAVELGEVAKRSFDKLEAAIEAYNRAA